MVKEVIRKSDFWTMKEIAEKLGYDWIELGSYGVFGYKKENKSGDKKA